MIHPSVVLWENFTFRVSVNSLVLICLPNDGRTLSSQLSGRPLPAQWRALPNSVEGPSQLSGEPLPAQWRAPPSSVEGPSQLSGGPLPAQWRTCTLYHQRWLSDFCIICVCLLISGLISEVGVSYTMWACPAKTEPIF